MSEVKTKTILLFGETHPIVLNILIEMGYDILYTTNFLQFCRQDISELDFSQIPLSNEETIALVESGFLQFQPDKDKILTQIEDHLSIREDTFSTQRQSVDFSDLHLKEPIFYSNKDRFHNKKSGVNNASNSKIETDTVFVRSYFPIIFRCLR